MKAEPMPPPKGFPEALAMVPTAAHRRLELYPGEGSLAIYESGPTWRSLVGSLTLETAKALRDALDQFIRESE